MNDSSNSSMASPPPSTPAPAASGWHIGLQYTVFIGIGCLVGLVIIASLVKKFFDAKRDRQLLRERQGHDKERQEMNERIDELQSIIETKSEIWSNGGDGGGEDEWDRVRAHSGIMNDALPSPILRRHTPSIASSRRQHSTQNSISSGYRKHGASNSISSSFLEVPSTGTVGNYTLSPSDRYRLVRDPTLVHPLPAAPRNILTPMKAMTEEREEEDDDTSLLNQPAPFFTQHDYNTSSDSSNLSSLSSNPSSLSPPPTSRHYAHNTNYVSPSVVDQQVYNSKSASTTTQVKSPSPRSLQKARSLRSTRDSNEYSSNRYQDASTYNRDSIPDSTRDSMRDSMHEEIIDVTSPQQPMPIHDGYDSDTSSIYSFGVNSYSTTPVHRPASIKSVRSNMSKKKRRSARPPPVIPPRRVSLREELYNPNNRV